MYPRAFGRWQEGCFLSLEKEASKGRSKRRAKVLDESIGDTWPQKREGLTWLFIKQPAAENS